MQKQQATALAQLSVARALLDVVNANIASATLALETHGAYEEHEQGDVCSAVRDSIAELESLIKQYVN